MIKNSGMEMLFTRKPLSGRRFALIGSRCRCQQLSGTFSRQSQAAITNANLGKGNLATNGLSLIRSGDRKQEIGEEVYACSTLNFLGTTSQSATGEYRQQFVVTEFAFKAPFSDTQTQSRDRIIASRRASCRVAVLFRRARVAGSRCGGNGKEG